MDLDGVVEVMIVRMGHAVEELVMLDLDQENPYPLFLV